MARSRRLVFYEDDAEVIQRALAEARRAVAMRFAMILHVEGHPMFLDADPPASSVGHPETLAALFAAAFAACREPRRLLDPAELEEVRMRTADRCLLLTLFSGQLILAAEYELNESPQERVESEVRRAIERVGAVVEAIHRRAPPDDPDDLTGARARLRPGDAPRRPPPAPGSSARAPDS